MPTNVLPVEKTAHLLQALGQPVRLQILLAIGDQETCVCHLETTLGLRQAHLSQHLMALRQSGLVSARRDGRFIHYRLEDPALLDLIHQAAKLQGLSLPVLSPGPECGCPNCKSIDCHET